MTNDEKYSDLGIEEIKDNGSHYAVYLWRNDSRERLKRVVIYKDWFDALILGDVNYYRDYPIQVETRIENGLTITTEISRELYLLIGRVKTMLDIFYEIYKKEDGLDNFARYS